MREAISIADSVDRTAGGAARRSAIAPPNQSEDDHRRGAKNAAQAERSGEFVSS